MRILITVPSLAREFGGPTAKARRLTEELRGRGHDVRLVGAGAGISQQVIGLPIVSRYHGTPIPARLGRVATLVRGADVVHVMGYRDPLSTVAAAAARHVGVPYVMEPVGMHRRRLRNLMLKRAYDRSIGRGLLSGAMAVIATSSLEAQELIHDGVDGSLVVVRPNGVDVDELLPLPERGSFRREHGVPDEASLVLSLGRISGKKGLLTFVQALDRLPGVWGAIVGPDDGDGTLGQLLTALDRSEPARVVVDPRGLWGSDKARAFADADAFCLPSATENFGNAPVEAAALGVPVSLSAACGAVEFLDGAATSVIDHRNVGSVARGIERSIMPEARAAAEGGAPGLRQRLGWARVTDQQEAIYERVARGSRARRLLVTVPSLRRSFGGPAVQAPAFVDALRQVGLSVRVASSDPAGEPAIDLGRIGSFHGTPIPRRLSPLVGQVRSADMVHVMGYRDPAGTFAALISRWHGVPLVVEPMGMHRRRVRSVRIKTGFDRTLGGAVIRFADVVVATSSLERDELVHDGVPPERIVVRPNGVDADGFAELPARGSFREQLGIPHDVPLVLFLGRITAKKGSLGLVRAVAELPGVWVAVVGPDDRDGTLRELRDEVLRLELQDRARVDPWGRWGAERMRAFADADAFCLDSMTENFGNAAAEAALLGVPVVVSDRCGIAEYLPAAGHRVVPYGNVAALRSALDWAVRPVAKQEAASAAPELRDLLDWSRIARQQASLYERIWR